MVLSSKSCFAPNAVYIFFKFFYLKFFFTYYPQLILLPTFLQPHIRSSERVALSKTYAYQVETGPVPLPVSQLSTVFSLGNGLHKVSSCTGDKFWFHCQWPDQHTAQATELSSTLKGPSLVLCRFPIHQFTVSSKLPLTRVSCLCLWVSPSCS